MCKLRLVSRVTRPWMLGTSLTRIPARETATVTETTTAAHREPPLHQSLPSHNLPFIAAFTILSAKFSPNLSTGLASVEWATASALHLQGLLIETYFLRRQ